MEVLIKISIISIITVILALLVAEKAPYFAIGIIVVSGVLVLSMTFLALEEVIFDINMLLKSAGIESEIYMPVIKVTIIAIIVKISADICKDAGFSSVSQKIQFSGSVASIIAVFPLFARIIDILKGIL